MHLFRDPGVGSFAILEMPGSRQGAGGPAAIPPLQAPPSLCCCVPCRRRAGFSVHTWFHSRFDFPFNVPFNVNVCR